MARRSIGSRHARRRTLLDASSKPVRLYARSWPASSPESGAPGRPGTHAGPRPDPGRRCFTCARALTHDLEPRTEKHMYPSREARELAILLRISRELDVCGDVTATVDNPSELLAWATVLAHPAITAWRAQDSGCRFVQVSADHHGAPVRGHVSAVLSCEQHAEFWDELPLENLEPGRTQTLTIKDLAAAWQAMPITPPDDQAVPRQPPTAGRST
jgi:hypothetical protein